MEYYAYLLPLTARATTSCGVSTQRVKHQSWYVVFYSLLPIVGIVCPECNYETLTQRCSNTLF